MAIPWGAILATLGTMGATVGSGFLNKGGDGGSTDEYMTDEQKNYYAVQSQLAQQQLDWSKYMQPQLQQLYGQLGPLLQQQLQKPGLPEDLETKVWQLARERMAKGYSGLSDQLGQLAASRGTLQSGATTQNWLDQVGLARAQGERELGVEKALANYQSQQQAISNAMGMMGGVPSNQSSMYGGMMQPQQQQPMDYSGLGTLFAKLFQGDGNKPGTSPGIQGGVGGQTFNTAQFGQTWSPYL